MGDEKHFQYISLLLHVCSSYSATASVCVLLTQRGVEEGEVSQVPGVLRQGEESPRVTVPHQAASGAMLEDAVLDDLHTGNKTIAR